MSRDKVIEYRTTSFADGRWHLEAWEDLGTAKILSRYIGVYSSKQEALLAAKLFENPHLLELEHPLPDRRGAIEHTRAKAAA